MACLVLDDEYMKTLPGFKKRLDWFMKNRKDLASQVSGLSVLKKILYYIFTDINKTFMELSVATI